MSDLNIEGFNVNNARLVTQLETQNGELIQDLNSLVKWVKNNVEMGFPWTEELENILKKIEMKRGVLFE